MIPAYLWPLANHLWQSTVFVGRVSLLTLALKRNRASVRYWLWLASSVKFLVPLSLLIGIGSHVQWRKLQPNEQPKMALAVDIATQSFSEPTPSPRLLNVPPTPHPIPRALPGVWLCGVLLSAFGYVRAWLRVSRSGAYGIAVCFGFCGGRISFRMVRSSAGLEPCVFGINHPVLILPDGIGDRLPPIELTTVLQRELCHVRRRDNLTVRLTCWRQCFSGFIHWCFGLEGGWSTKEKRMR